MNTSGKKTKQLAILAIVAILCATAFLVVETFRLMLPGLWTAFSSGDEQALSRYLNEQGSVRSFITLWFLSFVQVLSIVIPAMPVQLAAGIAYGPWKGFLNSFSASLIANMTVFFLARRLARAIDILTGDSPKIQKLLNSVRSSRDPWYYTVLAFLTPGLPNGIIPYAAAHANMRPRMFLAAILISLPVPTLLTCAAGSLILSGDWTFSILIGIGLYTFVGILFFKRSAVLNWIHARHERRAHRLAQKPAHEKCGK
jgi:uncharacterized membrane protein YdjX (TVP38/TMEM64 family)